MHACTPTYIRTSYIQVQTSSGTTMSILSWIVVLILVLSESRDAFLSPKTKYVGMYVCMMMMRIGSRLMMHVGVGRYDDADDRA